MGFGKFQQECHFLVFCLAASLSQERCLVTRNLSLGQEATEGLHSQENGWPGTSSLAVQTASPGSSTAHPANTRERERELSSHGCRDSLTQPFRKTSFEPGAPVQAATHLEGQLTVQRETDAHPSLPQTKVKPRCWGHREVCGDCLCREEKGQAHSKKLV